MTPLPIVLKAVTEMRLQAFTYGVFLTRTIAAGGEPKGQEPPAISLKAIASIERMSREVFPAGIKSFQSYAEFKVGYRELSVEPEGSLFGPSLKSFKWEYVCLHQWLDDLYWQLYSIATPEIMKDPEQPTYNINIRDVSGLVNINSHIDHAIQTVNRAPKLAAQSKEQLSHLLDELRTALASAPTTAASDTEIIAEQAEAVASEASRPEPRKKSIEIKANGLLEAAKAVEGILPTALSIAQRIAEFVAGTF